MPNRRLRPAPLAGPPCARPSFVLFVLSLAGCGPSDEEVQALVDARVQGLQSRLEQADVIPTDAELARTKPPYRACRREPHADSCQIPPARNSLRQSRRKSSHL